MKHEPDYLYAEDGSKLIALAETPVHYLRRSTGGCIFRAEKVLGTIEIYVPSPIWMAATGWACRTVRGISMTKYCITAANHKNANDDRASEFEVHQLVKKEKEAGWVWNRLGKKSLNEVAALLAQGHEVISAERKKQGDEYVMIEGYPIELELRIAKNDKKFKISQLPEF
ncbi:hypothetical protein [Burkholderia gladioli]|uniref:hypothetical protein n=1 Tax=Burkholderia gladioli TaxID=28095 RepID=UPI00164048FE|nr:hypothetical protein [Burkholderia gladioli]